MITIGMPVWNSRDIAWLAMESFCRQITKQPWELIIFEEKHPGACGLEFFVSYLPRLKEAGCKKLRIIVGIEKRPLSYKWRKLGQTAHEDSRMFCICDADNYYQKFMIEDTWKAYVDGYDWLTAKVGYFYNCTSGKLALYDLKERPAARTGLQMSISTDLIRKLPDKEKHRLLNNWIFNNCKPKNLKDEMVHQNTLCTHGKNNISERRGQMIDWFQPPFYKTNKKLEDIIPEEIATKLRAL